jgi:hypothetical protein
MHQKKNGILRSTLENKVIWKKNGKVLEAGESVVPPDPEDEPRIIVDTFNTLYLVNVKESEEGNYTCQVDDIRMQQIIIFVISKSRLLTQGCNFKILFSLNYKICSVCSSHDVLGPSPITYFTVLLRWYYNSMQQETYF